MSETVDVIVIGGGPAGLAAAIVLARAGLCTYLYEKNTFPVDKACGEGIMPVGVGHLHQLGITSHLEKNATFPFAGIRFHAANGRTAAAHFAEGPGLGVRRTALSAALKQAAQSYNCLQIFEATQAIPQTVTGRHIIVTNGSHTVKARLLVAADGLNSRVRRWAGLVGGRRRWQRWGASWHFRLPPSTDYVEVLWGKNGIEAYLTPTGPEQIGLAFLWDRTRYGPVRGGRSLLPSLLRPFPALQQQLQNVGPPDGPTAVGPLQQTASAVVSDGLLLIGDAAGYLDAITGEGISMALAQALALRQTVIPLLHRQEGVLRRQDLLQYQKAYRTIVRPYYLFTHLMLWLSRYQALGERVIGILHTHPTLFQKLLSASMGATKIRSRGIPTSPDY